MCGFEGMYILKMARWRSLEARRPHTAKVVGSNPAPAIFLCLFSFRFQLMKRFINFMGY